MRALRVPAVAAAVAVALAGAIYVTRDAGGNNEAVFACQPAARLAQSLGPLAQGEVAALQVAGTPDMQSDLGFNGPGGKPMTTADFHGKVTLMNLWATWCVPCRREMPALDRLQAALGSADFAVVPVSVDNGDQERPRAFLESVGARNLPLYTDSTTEIFNKLKGRGLALGLPVTLLLDRNGCRIGHMNGPAEWDSPEAQRLIQAIIAGERESGATDQATNTKRG